MIILMRAINFFFQVLIYLILGRAILSWFARPNNVMVYKIYIMIIQVTEPILTPCRKLLARFGLNGMIDFSPILAIVGLTIINSLLINLLSTLVF